MSPGFSNSGRSLSLARSTNSTSSSPTTPTFNLAQEITTRRVTWRGICVQAGNIDILERFAQRYPQFMANSKLHIEAIKTVAIDVLVDALKILKQNSAEGISASDLTILEGSLEDLRLFGFDVMWLEERMSRIKTASKISSLSTKRNKTRALCQNVEGCYREAKKKHEEAAKCLREAKANLATAQSNVSQIDDDIKAVKSQLGSVDLSKSLSDDLL